MANEDGGLINQPKTASNEVRVLNGGVMGSRVVVLDTETTGFSPTYARIVEVAALEVEPRSGQFGRHFHHIINPLRSIPAAVTKIHGLRDEDVRDKPPFAVIADELIEFLRGATIAIHNSSFDVQFLDAELARSNKPALDQLGVTVVDTVEIARSVYPLLPGHTLDHLCDVAKVDRKERTQHGALIDVRLLAATLPAIVAEYDTWMALVEDSCAAELDQFEITLRSLCNELIDGIDHSTAQSLDHALSRLATVLRWIDKNQETLKARCSVVLNGSPWCCKHFSARLESSESISWKSAADEHLEAHDLSDYMKTTTSRTLTPKSDDELEAVLLGLQPALDNENVTSSIHCIVRASLILRSVDKILDSKRDAVRAELLAFVDSGYSIRFGNLRESKRKTTDYKSAVADLAPEIDLTPFKSFNSRFGFRGRDPVACTTLFV